jgi:hypothetical protein
MSDKCENCRWWNWIRAANEHGRQGECRLHGPKAGPDVRKAIWPITYDGDSCGDFKHRDDRATRLLQTKYMTRGEAA